jgi:septum formation protein
MININNSGYKIILASQSPRRHFLLKETGINFDVMVKSTDEEYPLHLEAEEIALWISEHKAKAFNFVELPINALLITADTIVWVEGQIIGKPESHEDARRMLRLLSGKPHTVITGVTFRTAQKIHSFNVNTTVWFRELGEDEIDYYIDKCKPYDKAGAYGIQEWIGYIGVEKIDGSFYNVMGLPVQKVYTELQKFITQ